MKFSQSLIEEIKLRSSLSGVIAKNVKLLQRGSQFIGLCPFHKEKTPSFTVQEDKGFYHCFGCQEHGDIFDYVMKSSNLTFSEAVISLANEAGIDIKVEDKFNQENDIKLTKLRNLMQQITEWFSDQLIAGVGGQGLRYLNTREITEDIIKKYELGFAPNGWDQLKQNFLKMGYTEEDLIQAGVLINSESSNKTYDRYRNRIIFPIKNMNGRVVGFGGRAIDDAKAKYINSPETELYKKRNNLYGIFEAKKHIRESDSVIVVEGYTDVLSLVSSGYKNTVASLGTALTDAQIKLIWNLTNEPIICLDGDSAGRRAAFLAAERALPLLRPGLTLRFAVLPSGYDPDLMVKELGVNKFDQVLKESISLSELLWLKEKNQLNLETPERQSGFIKRLEDSTNKILDNNVRSSFKNAYKTRFREEFGFYNKINHGKEGKKWSFQKFQQKPSSKNILKTSLLNEGGHLSREKFIVAAVVRFPELLEKGDELFGKPIFISNDLDRCRSKILQAVSNGVDQSADLLNFLDLAGLGKVVKNTIETAKKGHSSFFEGDFREEILIAWQEAVALHERAALQREIDSAWKEYIENSTESAKSRLLSLQEELGDTYKISTRGNLINN